MPDLLDRTRREVANRINELKPLLDEHNRLEVALSALGTADGSNAPTPPRRHGPGRRRRSLVTTPTRTATTATANAPEKPRGAPKRRPGRRKGGGSRGAEANALVQGQPGITIPQLAAKMGIKQNYLYRVVPALEKEGKVVKRGRGWHPKG
jgi:hypothetical protein